MHRASGSARTRAGVALLEALIALAVLGTTGAAMAALTVSASAAVRRANDADADTRAASAFLDAVALWSREDLDRHLGEHAQGLWRLEVQRQSERLYVATLRDSSGTRELLHTALFRPDRPAEAHDVR